MLRAIRRPIAAHILLGIQAIALVYHALIITRVVPFENVWGGRLTSVEQMYRFETFSVALNLFMVAIVLVAGDLWKIKAPERLLRVVCWLLFGLFLLNTLGNLAATSTFEMVAFTPLTLASALLFARLALRDASRVRAIESR